MLTLTCPDDSSWTDWGAMGPLPWQPGAPEQPARTLALGHMGNCLQPKPGIQRAYPQCGRACSCISASPLRRQGARSKVLLLGKGISLRKHFPFLMFTSRLKWRELHQDKQLFHFQNQENGQYLTLQPALTRKMWCQPLVHTKVRSPVKGYGGFIGVLNMVNPQHRKTPSQTLSVTKSLYEV